MHEYGSEKNNLSQRAKGIGEGSFNAEAINFAKLDHEIEGLSKQRGKTRTEAAKINMTSRDKIRVNKALRDAHIMTQTGSTNQEGANKQALRDRQKNQISKDRQYKNEGMVGTLTQMFIDGDKENDSPQKNQRTVVKGNQKRDPRDPRGGESGDSDFVPYYGDEEDDDYNDGYDGYEDESNLQGYDDRSQGGKQPSQVNQARPRMVDETNSPRENPFDTYNNDENSSNQDHNHRLQASGGSFASDHSDFVPQRRTIRGQAIGPANMMRPNEVGGRIKFDGKEGQYTPREKTPYQLQITEQDNPSNTQAALQNNNNHNNSPRQGSQSPVLSRNNSDILAFYQEQAQKKRATSPEDSQTVPPYHENSESSNHRDAPKALDLKRASLLNKPPLAKQTSRSNLSHLSPRPSKQGSSSGSPSKKSTILDAKKRDKNNLMENLARLNAQRQIDAQEIYEEIEEKDEEEMGIDYRKRIKELKEGKGRKKFRIPGENMEERIRKRKKRDTGLDKWGVKSVPRKSRRADMKKLYSFKNRPENHPKSHQMRDVNIELLHTDELMDYYRHLISKGNRDMTQHQRVMNEIKKLEYQNRENENQDLYKQNYRFVEGENGSLRKPVPTHKSKSKSKSRSKSRARSAIPGRTVIA